MSTTTTTIPSDFLDTIRAPDAMCTCGRPADEHEDRMGFCAASGCQRWTWPGDAPRPTERDLVEALRALQDACDRLMGDTDGDDFATRAMMRATAVLDAYEA